DRPHHPRGGPRAHRPHGRRPRPTVGSGEDGAAGTGGWAVVGIGWHRLLVFLHFEVLVRHLAVGFAVDGESSLLAGGFGEAKTLAGRGVVPVLQVAHAVLALDRQVPLVQRGERLGREAGGGAVHVKKARHRSSPLLIRSWHRRWRLRASSRGPPPTPRLRRL